MFASGMDSLVFIFETADRILKCIELYVTKLIGLCAAVKVIILNILLKQQDFFQGKEKWSCQSPDFRLNRAAPLQNTKLKGERPPYK